MNQSITPDLAAVVPAVTSSGLLRSLCSIVEPPEVFDDGGAPDPTAAYTPVTGLQNIPCIAAPLSDGDTVQPNEVKSLSELLSKSPLHVWLSGYYPQIWTNNRAVVDGVTYDILGVEWDSEHTQTRLAVQEMTV